MERGLPACRRPRGTLAEPSKETFTTFARRFVGDVLKEQSTERPDECQEIAAAPASATVWSFSTVLPETPIAPMIVSPYRIGIPPGKLIKPPLECSMLKSAPPGWESLPISPVFMSK